ncbi:hypothetical protein AGIG_G22134 [Arapaima gigas]
MLEMEGPFSVASLRGGGVAWTPTCHNGLSCFREKKTTFFSWKLKLQGQFQRTERLGIRVNFLPGCEPTNWQL